MPRGRKGTPLKAELVVNRNGTFFVRRGNLLWCAHVVKNKKFYEVRCGEWHFKYPLSRPVPVVQAEI